MEEVGLTRRVLDPSRGTSESIMVEVKLGFVTGVDSTLDVRLAFRLVSVSAAAD